MRKIIEFFIKFEIASNILIIGFIFFGMAGALSINSSFFPLMPSNTISISAVYPGASPQEVEEGVILKIEDNLKGIKGIDRVTSKSKENYGIITVETFRNQDINVVLQDVKNAVDKTPSFPTGMEPIVVSKIESIRETMAFSINGHQIPLKALKQIAKNIEIDLRRMDGISQIGITGYPDEEIEIAVFETNMRAYNLTFQDIEKAVSRANLLVSGGTIKTNVEDYLIRARNRGYYANELDNLIVQTSPNGNVIRLKDVAQVRDRFSETPNADYFNGKLSVGVTISNTNTEDLISTAEKVNKYIEKFNQTHNNVHLDVLFDSSVTLNQRTKLLLKNGIVGVLLVMIFLSLFLNTRLAFWVSFGMPISFLGMFIFASYVGITINVLSLFGMIIVIGILVDDGIVIAENIYQHYQRGKTSLQAAVDGTLEVLPAVLSAVITTMLAFSVFLFLDGNIGNFFSEVSTVVILTLAVSLIEALIILPVHIAHSKVLSKQKESDIKSKNPIKRFFAGMRNINKFGNKVLLFLRNKLYMPSLRFGLKNKVLMLSFFIAMLLLTFGSMSGGIIKSTFFPVVASDRIRINLKMPEGTNENITDSIIKMIEKKAWVMNEEFTAKQTGGKQVVQDITRRIGPGTSKATLIIDMLPGEERDFSSFEITSDLRKKVGNVTGAESLIFNSGGHIGGSPVSVSLLSNNIKQLKAAKRELKDILSKNPMLKDINDNDPSGIKEIQIILKDNAYLMGLSLQSVMAQVRAGFFGQQVQRFQRGQDEIKVWVRYDRENRGSLNHLDEMRIRTPSGDQIPFSGIATYEINRGDVEINHLEGIREIKVSADLKDAKVSASDIMNDIRMQIIPNIQAKYATIKTSYEGQDREFKKIQNSAKKVIPAILFLIYIVIAFTFRSYIQPLLLFAMTPFSVIGVAWGHWNHDVPINILSWLGIIALVGIMVNDGLVFIEKYNILRREGASLDEALLGAGESRFRAVFLTSLTTMAGMAPLILEKSRQAQFLIPMAISISYGIAIATVLTLIVLPILLAIVAEISTFFKSIMPQNK